MYDYTRKELKDEMLKKLLAMPNAVIIPHRAFAISDTLTNIADTTFCNIDCWKMNQRPKTN